MKSQTSTQLSTQLKHNYVTTKKDYDDLLFIAEQTRELSRPRKKLTLEQEVTRSRYLFRDAHRTMHNVMLQIRQGDRIDVSRLQKLTQRIMQRLNENQEIFLSVCRDKQRSEYIFMRSVSFSALMLMFSRSLGFNDKELLQIGSASLLHDAGKMWLPIQLLNKPGKLNPHETLDIHDHIKYNKMILFSLEHKPSSLALQIACEHHERTNGTGYPSGLRGKDISLIGQAAGIVDVFDAMTSNRHYGEPVSPTEALQYLLLHPGEFDSELVQHFIKTIGIYPTGTLVELNGGILGIVMKQGTDLRFPKVKLLYDLQNRRRLPASTIKLTPWGDNTIVKTLTEKQSGLYSKHLLS